MTRTGKTPLTGPLTICFTFALMPGLGFANSEVTSLTLWDTQPWEPFRGTFAAQIDQCAPEGVEISHETIPGGQFVSRVLNSASTGDLPDVLLPEGDQIYVFHEAGILAEIGQYGIDISDRSEVVASMGLIDGELYGVAQNVNTLALFYNRDMLDEAGITPPVTWDELVSAASALSTPDGRVGITLAADASSTTGGYMFLPWFLSAGGDPRELDSDAMRQTLQLYADLVDTGGASREIVNLAWDANDWFRSGDAAMMVSQEFSVEQLENDGMNFGVAPIPVPTANGVSRTALGGQVLALVASTEERERVAAEFIACLVSHEMQISMAVATGRTPASTAAQDEYVALNPSMAPFSQLAGGSFYTPAIGAIWADHRDKVSAAVQLVIAARLTPDEAIAAVITD